MSQVCEITGKRPNFGNNRSHANNKTRTRWDLNLKTKKYAVPELGKNLVVLLSTRAIRTIDRFPTFSAALLDVKETLLSERLQRLRRQVKKARTRVAQPKGEKAAKAPKAAAAKPAKKTAKKK